MITFIIVLGSVMFISFKIGQLSGHQEGLDAAVKVIQKYIKEHSRYNPNIPD